MRIRGIVVPAALLLSGCDRGPTPPDASGRNVVVISVDTLRSDRLPAYGYGGIETPAIDALASDAILFERAYSHYPLTLPSHASLFTGLLPPDHGVRNNKGYFLEDGFETLAERLQAAGYDTAGFASSMVLRASTGVSQGFAVWDFPDRAADDEDRRFAQRRGDVAVGKALAWLASRQDSKPFFLFVHIFDPHTPYEAPEPFASRYEDAYDAEVAYSDTLIAELIGGLKRRELYDDSLVVFLSDHGEGLGDHVELEHGLLLNREMLQVPLLVKLPAAERGGERVARPVALIDVAPTLLGLVGRPSSGLPGESLLDEGGEARRSIYAETFFGLEQYGFAEVKSVIAGPDHYIHSPKPELYDLIEDPAERHNLLPERQVPARMAQTIVAAGDGRKSVQQISAEEERRLAALGYLGYLGGPARDAGETGERPDPKDHIHEVAEMWRLMDELGSTPSPEPALRLAELVRGLGLRQEGLGRTIATNLLHHGLVPPAAAALAPFAESSEVETVLLLGEIDTARGHFPDARARFDQVLAADAGNAHAHRNMGILLLTQGRVSEARRSLERAVGLDASQAPAWNGLGVVHIQAGDLEGAVTAWQKAVAADPQLSDAWFNLAVTHERLGSSGEAARALERYIPLVQGPERRKAEAMLSSLRSPLPLKGRG